MQYQSVVHVIKRYGERRMARHATHLSVKITTLSRRAAPLSDRYPCLTSNKACVMVI